MLGSKRRQRGHREDPAGARLDRDDRGLDGRAGAFLQVGQRLERRVLGLTVEGELDVAALARLVGQQVDQLVDEQQVVVPGEHVVLAAFDAGLVEEREVARRVGVLERLHVGAQEVVLVVGLHALRHRLAADEDRAALAGVRRLDHPAVARVVVVGVGLPVLQPRRVEHQRHEQQQAEDGDGADRLVHAVAPPILMTWVAWSSALSSSTAERSGTGRRAWSEMRRSSATITQFATSDEPP